MNIIYMIIPVRCFSCGKPIGHLWEEFKKQVEEGEQPKKVLDNLELERFCCRSMFLGQTDLIELVGEFKKS
jgi:DNA-directed RNA polymerase subunit N